MFCTGATSRTSDLDPGDDDVSEGMDDGVGVGVDNGQEAANFGLEL